VAAVEAVLEPAVSLEVIARAAGWVREVRARVGDQVHAGDTLACLDDRQAQLRLQAARIWADQQQQRLARMRPLLAQGGIAALDLLTLENEARLAQVRVEEALLEAEGTVLLAPIAGTVAAVAIAAGQPVTTTTACVRLVDRRRLKAQLHLPVYCLAQVHTGQRVIVRTALPLPTGPPEAGGGTAPSRGDTAACRPRADDPAIAGAWLATGRLDHVDPEVVPGTDRVGATATITAAPGLLPGLVVRVEIAPR
jgi:multidrug resistance efflux pump